MDELVVNIEEGSVTFRVKVIPRASMSRVRGVHAGGLKIAHIPTREMVQAGAIAIFETWTQTGVMCGSGAGTGAKFYGQSASPPRASMRPSGRRHP